MKKIAILIIFSFLSTIGISQNQKEKVLYVVDSIPVIDDPEEGFGSLPEDEIDRIEVVKNKQAIEKTGYNDLDGIIYIFTKSFANRPDRIKAIPTTKLMNKDKGTWYLKNESQPYTGPFIDYYLNGKIQGEGFLSKGKLKGKRIMYYINGEVSSEVDYEKGLPNGTEKRFYEDGTLMQKGNFKNGNEIGIWEMYHPNGELKQRTNFVDGKMDGESFTYYSTGELKGVAKYKDGKYQKDKETDKLFKYYNQGQALYKQGNFKAAIKKYSKCINIRENWADGYFARATAKLNNLEFDEAIMDFNKTLEIEPYYTNAYSNRAFTILRKHELGNGRTLSNSNGVQVIASKKTDIPESELSKICADLKKAISLGDDHWMVLEALEKHCTE